MLLILSNILVKAVSDVIKGNKISIKSEIDYSKIATILADAILPHVGGVMLGSIMKLGKDVLEICVGAVQDVTSGKETDLRKAFKSLLQDMITHHVVNLVASVSSVAPFLDEKAMKSILGTAVAFFDKEASALKSAKVGAFKEEAAKEVKRYRRRGL